MDNNNPNQPGGPSDSQMGQERVDTPPYVYVPQSYPQTEEPVESVTGQSEIYDAPVYLSEPDPNRIVLDMGGPTQKMRGGSGILIGAVALIVLIAAGAVGMTYFNRLANRPAVDVARLLPQNTIAYLTLDTNVSGKQKESLDKIKTAFESQPGFKEAWSKITSEAMQSTGQASDDAASGLSDFDSLAQYLGNNLTVAVLAPSTADLESLENSMGGFTSEGGGMEDVMLRNVAGILDLDFNPLDKKGPISELKNQVDTFANAPVAETYRELEIHKYITGTATIYFSLLNGTSTVVVGGKVEPVRVMIDQFKDGKGLSEDARYKSLMAQVSGDNIASLYVNLTEIYKDLALAQPEMFSDSATKASGAALLTLSAQDGGMQLDMASEAEMEGAGITVNPNAHPGADTLSDIPAGSLGFLAGTDLKSTIQSALDVMRKQSAASGGEDMIQSTLNDMEAETGLNFEKDVLPWMGGDYVLSMSADAKDGEPMPAVVFQMKVSASDHDKARDALQAVVKSMSNGEEQMLDVPEGTFYAPSPDAGIVVGVAKDRLLVIYDSEVAAATSRIKTVVGNLGKGLGSTEQWKEVASHLPKDSNAIMYLDITGIRGLTEGIMVDYVKTEYEQNTAPFMRPFKYLAMGSAASPGSEGSLTHSHSVLFLGISK